MLLRNSSSHIFRYLASIIVLGFVFYSFFSHPNLSSLSSSLRTQVLCPVDSSSENEAKVYGIVIPGGGLIEGGVCPPHTVARITRAVELYNECQKGQKGQKEEKKCIIFTLSAGTPHKPPPLDSNNFPIYEGAAAAKELLNHGVRQGDIFEENLSLDTIGNAYFLRTIHTDLVPNLRDLHIVTNNWHMGRTMAIFEYVFSLPSTATSTSTITTTSRCTKPYRMHAHAVDDVLPPAILQKRVEREKESLQIFQTSTKAQFTDLQSLHSFIYQEHAAYSTKRHASQYAKALDPQTLATY